MRPNRIWILAVKYPAATVSTGFSVPAHQKAVHQFGNNCLFSSGRVWEYDRQNQGITQIISGSSDDLHLSSPASYRRRQYARHHEYDEYNQRRTHRSAQHKTYNGLYPEGQGELDQPVEDGVKYTAVISFQRNKLHDPDYRIVFSDIMVD